MLNSGLSPAHQTLIDAAIIGTGTGAFAWILLIGNRDRRRRVREDLARIAELNHEIRNALQVIAHTQYIAQQPHRELVLASVGRVDEVLRRLFPVVGGNARQRPSQPTNSNPASPCDQ